MKNENNIQACESRIQKIIQQAYKVLTQNFKNSIQESAAKSVISAHENYKKYEKQYQDCEQKTLQFKKQYSYAYYEFKRSDNFAASQRLEGINFEIVQDPQEKKALLIKLNSIKRKLKRATINQEKVNNKKIMAFNHQEEQLQCFIKVVEITV